MYVSFKVSLDFNIAIGKVTHSSSLYVNLNFYYGTSDNTVDGCVETNATYSGCCFATLAEIQPWLTVDLGEMYRIIAVSVLPRSDHDSKFFNNHIISKIKIIMINKHHLTYFLYNNDLCPDLKYSILMVYTIHSITHI